MIITLLTALGRKIAYVPSLANVQIVQHEQSRFVTYLLLEIVDALVIDDLESSIGQLNARNDSVFAEALHDIAKKVNCVHSV